MTKRKKQKGAALLVVLLLAATLSFIALASMEKISLSAARAGNVNERSEAVWQALAIETLATSAIETAYDANDSKMSRDDPWANKPIELPLDDGMARVIFDDATTCFNINSFAQSSEDDAQNLAIEEFVRLAKHIGLGEFEAEAIAQSIADWIDDDNQRRPQGAEDEYYTTLSSPYRTANKLAAAVTEIRAIKNVTKESYLALAPSLCAMDRQEPSPINVNMLERSDAAVLAAVLGDDVSLRGAADIIAGRPPGGYSDITAFLAEPSIKKLELKNEVTNRFEITSHYLKARAEIIYDRKVLTMTSEIAMNGDRARVVSRRIGAEM